MASAGENGHGGPLSDAEAPLLARPSQRLARFSKTSAQLGRPKLSRSSLAVPSPEVSSPNLTGWILLVVFTHVLWGLYPVASRFLQNQKEHPLPAMRMITFVNGTAFVVLGLTYTLPRYLLQRKKTSDLEDGSVAQTPLREIVTGALIMGVSVSVLAAGTIVGSSYTSAYLVLLVFMCAPLLVAPLSYIVLKAPMSPLLYPTIAATILGAGLVVCGGLKAGPEVALGRSDFMGMGIALAGTIGQAVFIVWVQKTRAFISNDAVLYINYTSMLSFAPAISLAVENKDWGGFLHYDALEFASLFYLAVGVYVFGNLLQQIAVRKVGAPVFATFICVRLLASVVGSYILLDERIQNATEAAGCIVIVLAVTMYLVVQALINRVSK